MTPRTAARQAPLEMSMALPRQEYWRGLPFPSLGDLPGSGIEPLSTAMAGGFFTKEPLGSPLPSGIPCKALPPPRGLPPDTLTQKQGVVLSLQPRGADLDVPEALLTDEAAVIVLQRPFAWQGKRSHPLDTPPPWSMASGLGSPCEGVSSRPTLSSSHEAPARSPPEIPARVCAP